MWSPLLNRTDSVNWTDKSEPKSLFSILSKIFPVIMSDNPHTHKSLRPQKLMENMQSLYILQHLLAHTMVTLLWYQRVLSSWRGNHQLCHHHHRHNWVREFLLHLAVIILLLLWGRMGLLQSAPCLWFHSGKKDNPGLLIPSGKRFVRTATMMQKWNTQVIYEEV